MKTIDVEYNDTVKTIEIDKLLYVISRLEDKEIKAQGKEEILKLLEKHGLYDDEFLDNVNKLW